MFDFADIREKMSRIDEAKPKIGKVAFSGRPQLIKIIEELDDLKDHNFHNVEAQKYLKEIRNMVDELIDGEQE